jgi:hypothetical protein
MILSLVLTLFDCNFVTLWCFNEMITFSHKKKNSHGPFYFSYFLFATPTSKIAVPSSGVVEFQQIFKNVTVRIRQIFIKFDRLKKTNIQKYDC